jgi:ubiquitin-activating enzyme E1
VRKRVSSVRHVYITALWFALCDCVTADTIVPFKTRTYREGGQAVEGGGVPMCTLRNFPQITDHCIEWSRDQFALLFTKLVKSAESFVANPVAFRAEIDGMTDTAQAIFVSRSVLSFLKAVASPSIGTCAQLSFDIFYFLFRDRILDLQNTFPADSRIVGKDGKDKGPYWSEKKRYPRVCEFNPADSNHTSFLLACTCLFGVAIGLITPKREDDDTWLRDYRRPEFIAEVASKLAPPEYIFCPIKTDDEPGGAEDSKSTSTGSTGSSSTAVGNLNRESILSSLFADMHAVAGIGSGLVLPELAVADFEKDDDFNFHIDFITAAANLRCDNYYIKRTDFQSCKVIAGKIIAAIATTTAAVCGLVILELFKLLQKKNTDAYMNRQIGLSVNTFTSFTADEPRRFKTQTIDVPPDPTTQLPDNAYDEKGKLKAEFIEKVQKIAYPDGHSVWDKITCSASFTLKQFSEFLLSEHNLKMTNWDFIVGYKPTFDEDGKKVGTAGESTPVYPPKAVIDYSLLPALDLSMNDAIKAIMRAKLPQEYQKVWKECKARGCLPDPSSVNNEDVITADTTIIEILSKMERIGASLEATKQIDARTVTGIHKRRFWIIPSNETPTCIDVNSGEQVETLCAIKFVV